MKDREFLEWVAARLVRQGDSPRVDFVNKLLSVANTIPEDQETPNIGGTDEQYAKLREVEADEGPRTTRSPSKWM